MTTTRLANNTVVTSTNNATSPMFSMSGNNALNVQFTVLAGGSGASNLVITAQGSDDMENWTGTGVLSNPTGTFNGATVGSTGAYQVTAFGYAYGRLLYTLGGTPATTVIAVDVNTYTN